MKVRRYVGVALAAATVSAVVADAPAYAAQRIITTIAGTGTTGYGGDGGPALAAQMDDPSGIAVDSSGNLYLADYGNDRVRKITASTGIIDTIAGTGTGGFSGDDGLATAAQVNDPTDVAVDSAGNVYIADCSNHRVRKITASTGNITTIAGTGAGGFSGDDGLATAAQLNCPNGLGLDSSGNLYIADYYNHRIRKITAATGNITTIAGTGVGGFSGDDGLATAAQLNEPLDVVIDSSGNAYISDYNNNRIRKVTAATGNITTIAGDGSNAFSGDGGLAVNAALSDEPGFLAVDSANNLYIPDYDNARVRKITASTGIIDTIAGTGANASTGDGGPATAADVDGPWAVAVRGTTVFILDYDRGVIRKVYTQSVLPPTGAGTDVVVWLATALFTAGAVLVATRRRVAL